MKRAIALSLVVLLFAGIMAIRFSQYYAQKANLKKQAASRKDAPLVVAVQPAAYTTLSSSYQCVGNIESPLTVNISSQIVGTVQYLKVRQGDHVNAGEVLVKIDPAQIQTQVSQAQANLSQAQSRYLQAATTTNANSVSIISQIHVEQAALRSAQANYTQTVENDKEQISAARSAVTDAKTKVASAIAAISSANAVISSAKANLANSKASYNRTDSLFKQGYETAQDVDNARTQVAVSQSAVDTAQSGLTVAEAGKNSAEAEESSAVNNLNITVNKGQSDIAAAAAAVAQARASLELAQANQSQKPAYQANLNALKSAVTAASDQLNSAITQLGYTTIRSPIDGWVTARNADPGSTATVGEILLTVQQLSKLYISVPVPEEEIAQIHLGTSVVANLDALPGKTFRGKVTYINPSANLLSRQFTVRVSIDNPGDVVMPGMFAHVTFMLQREPNVLTIPREALIKKGSRSEVAVVDAKSICHLENVTTGATDGSKIQIKSGLSAGDNVVIQSARPVKDGMIVKIAPSIPLSQGSTSPVQSNGALG